jgi:hypothetical protein
MSGLHFLRRHFPLLPCASSFPLPALFHSLSPMQSLVFRVKVLGCRHFPFIPCAVLHASRCSLFSTLAFSVHVFFSACAGGK